MDPSSDEKLIEIKPPVKQQSDDKKTIKSSGANVVKKELGSKCFVCSTTVSSSTDLKLHMKKEHKREDAFQCPDCLKTYKELDPLITHGQTYHKWKKECKRRIRFVCQVCAEGYKKLDDFKAHMKSEHNQDKAFPCSSCDKFFETPRCVNIHFRRVHKNERPYTCTLCQKSFQIIGNLDRHLKNVHEKNKSFLCTKCPMKFCQKSSLDMHMGCSHSTERPYKCQECPSSFGHPQSLNSHVSKVHHNARRYLCHNCPAKFGYGSNLKKHLDNHSCGNQAGRPKNVKDLKKRKPKCTKKSLNDKSSKILQTVEKLHPSEPNTQHLVVKSEQKNEVIDLSPEPVCFHVEEDSYSVETIEVSLTDTVIREMAKDLKYRLYLLFKDQSDVVGLISKRAVNSNDLFNIVIAAEKANLKSSELIEAVVNSFENN